ncbi:MAG: hypothetical protein LBG62_04745 [Candidatus Methanoplasma sp.]|jgi:hypothetical protein|nr:hypothetical protein [Candidatus Methanoplasma sp.]
MDDEAFLQVMMSNMYMRRHGISPEEFLRIDAECDLLGFLRDGYVPFHLTGPEGVLREMEEFIAIRPEGRDRRDARE